MQGSTTTAIVASISSGDFDISQRRGLGGQSTGIADLVDSALDAAEFHSNTALS